VLDEFEVVHVFRSCLLASCPPVPEPDAVALVGAWDFEETAGWIAADSSGLNNPATRHDGAEWTAFGYADSRGISLDGASGHLTTEGPVLLTDRSFTVSAWARLTQLPSSDRSVVAQFGNEISVFRLQYRASTGQWCMTSRVEDLIGSAFRHACGIEPDVGTWVHLAGVYDAAAHELRMYADGQLVGTRTSVDLWQASGPLVIGARILEPADGFFPGEIDQVMVFQGAASSSQIAS
jgi:hypothetical protein